MTCASLTGAEVLDRLRTAATVRPPGWLSAESDEARARRLCDALYPAPGGGDETCVNAQALARALREHAETIADPDRRAQVLIAAQDVTSGKTRAWGPARGDTRIAAGSDGLTHRVLHRDDPLVLRCELSGAQVELRAADMELTHPLHLRPVALTPITAGGF